MWLCVVCVRLCVCVVFFTLNCKYIALHQIHKLMLILATSCDSFQKYIISVITVLKEYSVIIYLYECLLSDDRICICLVDCPFKRL